MPARGAASPAVRVELASVGSDAEHALLAARIAIESIAREALLEPGFDLAHELRRPFARCFGAWSRDELAGFLIGSRVSAELHVLSVVVAPRWRRLGVGSALTAAALADGKDSRLEIALLEVRRSNIAAIRLYRALGFVAVRLRKSYYTTPPDDAVEMAAELEPGALAAFGEPVDLG